MTLPKPIAIILFLVVFCLLNNPVNAQLWRYLNDSPEKQKAADLAVEREASSVKTASIVAYSDTLQYKIITYSVQSLDGSDDKISVSYKPFSGKLIIQSSNDSLCINDYNSTDSVHFLNKNFLELLYSPRGGSDDGYQNTMILYIDKGKIGTAMVIETDHQFSLFNGGWGEYYATVKLTGKNQNSYEMLIKTNDRLYSKTHPSKNHNLHSQFVLKFDERKNIFYNNLKMINGWFDVLDHSTGKIKAKKHLSRSYPVIQLGKYENYYIDGIWCSVGKNSLISDYEKL